MTLFIDDYWRVVVLTSKIVGSSESLIFGTI